MSIVTRGLGSQLVVTRGLGPFVAYFPPVWLKTEIIRLVSSITRIVRLQSEV
jgi:hypothetical protein